MCMEYLKRKAESILQWSHQIGKQVFSDRTLRKYLSQLRHSQTDIDLLLAHLKHTKQLISEEVDLGGSKATMIKLRPESDSLDEKEKAKFILETNIANLSERVEQTTSKIAKLTADIQAMVKVSKKSALVLLSQRKKLEAFLEKV